MKTQDCPKTQIHMSVSFRTIPIFVSDATVRYFLFDVLLPTSFSETSTLSCVSMLQSLRYQLVNQKSIDTTVASWLDTLPFVQFNHLFLPTSNTLLRTSDETVSTLHVGDTSFSLSTMENDDTVMCMSIMKVYL
jgi:hypothetical protein